jgi:thioredoxin 1
MHRQPTRVRSVKIVSRILKSLLAFPFLAALSMPAHAGEIVPFTISAFHAAQDAGEPILVDAHAWWCPICLLQGPTINGLSTDPNFARLVIFKLDYETQRTEKHELGIREQSTLIAFAGKTETARAAGITNANNIRQLAATALR